MCLTFAQAQQKTLFYDILNLKSSLLSDIFLDVFFRKSFENLANFKYLDDKCQYISRSSPHLRLSKLPQFSSNFTLRPLFWCNFELHLRVGIFSSVELSLVFLTFLRVSNVFWYPGLQFSLHLINQKRKT